METGELRYRKAQDLVGPEKPFLKLASHSLSPRQEEQSEMTLGEDFHGYAVLTDPFWVHFYTLVLVFVCVRQCGKVSSPSPLETFSPARPSLL